MADHELHGLVNIQLGFQSFVASTPSPLLHGVLRLDAARSHQLHRHFDSRTRVHKFYLDPAFPWIGTPTSRHDRHPGHDGFLHLARQSNSFLGSAVLCGIGASPGETLGPVIIADITFLHERGFWMGLYQWAFWSGLMV
jgi:hypothetical protein